MISTNFTCLYGILASHHFGELWIGKLQSVFLVAFHLLYFHIMFLQCSIILSIFLRLHFRI